MARTSRSRSPSTRNRTLAIRTRDPLPQNATVTPVVSEFVSTQADRCTLPGCLNTLPHQHSPAEGEIAPSIEEYQKVAEAIRERWTEEQRRRIAENEALLRELAEIEPKVDSLSVKTHLPRGNDLTVQEQIAIIHSGASPVDQVSDGASLSASWIEDESRTQAEQTTRLELDDFPKPNDQYEAFLTDEIPSNLLILSHDARNGTPLFYQTTSFPELNCQNENSSRPHRMPMPDHKWTLCFRNGNPIIQQPLYRYRFFDPPPCTGPCPIQTPHIKGPYLQRGGVPRVWNPRWGFSDPPRAVWEAWLRVMNGRARSWDRVQVDGFSKSHSWWAQGPQRWSE